MYRDLNISLSDENSLTIYNTFYGQILGVGRDIPKHTNITLQQAYSEHQIKWRDIPNNSTNSQIRQDGSLSLFLSLSL